MNYNLGKGGGELSRTRAAQALIGRNFKRLRLAVLLTQEALAEEICIDFGVLVALEAGQEAIPMGIFSNIAAAFGISSEELIVELGKGEKRSVTPPKQTVVELAAVTPDRIEVLRLRDAIEEERRKAEGQLELLINRRGMNDIFTREAARRRDRLACILEINSA